MGYSSEGKEGAMSDSKHRERPWVTVDVVMVAPMDAQLKVLLIRRKRPPFEGCWAIPGGFIEPNESLEVAARRELWEETGAEPAHLEQLHTFSEPGRDPRGWIISVAHLAILSKEDLQSWQLRASSDAEEIGWFDLDDPPPLAFDHADILAYARMSLESRNLKIRQE
jgi:8-oxo-dGTP diphosphatase